MICRFRYPILQDMPRRWLRNLLLLSHQLRMARRRSSLCGLLYLSITGRICLRYRHCHKLRGLNNPQRSVLLKRVSLLIEIQKWIRYPKQWRPGFPDPAGCGREQNSGGHPQPDHRPERSSGDAAAPAAPNAHLHRRQRRLPPLPDQTDVWHAGITAYGSPAPDSPIEANPFLRTLYSLREMAVATLWHLHIRY